MTLRSLADAYGIVTEHQDGLGQTVVPSDDTLRSLLRVLGLDVEGLDAEGLDDAERTKRLGEWQRVLPKVCVAFDEAPALTVRVSHLAWARVIVTTRQGEVLCAFDRDLAREPGHEETHYGERFFEKKIALPELPYGRHHVAVSIGGHRHEAALFRAPTRARPLSERQLGAFLPLYALRSERGLGPDLTALHRLCAWLKEQGVSCFGTLPLHAQFLLKGSDAQCAQPFEPSPYSPASRLFWNELFLDPEATADGAQVSPVARDELDALMSADLIDYDALARCKRAILEGIAETYFDRDAPGLEAFLERRPHAEEYARFRAQTETRGAAFHQWGDASAEALAKVDGEAFEERVRYHLFAQVEMERQLAAADALPLYLDLPLGVHPDGYDAWRFRDFFLDGVSAGAPPDALFTGGQDWGFRPMHPERARDDGYDYLYDCLGREMERASILRVDHVMGLHRIYCVPPGASATSGAYLRYRPDELYALLTLASHEHGAAIVGEDLGTVPHAVREAMNRHGLLRMHVAQFEVDPGAANPVDIVRAPPTESLASLNTHDLPTFGGFLACADADVRRDLGMLSEGQRQQEKRARAQVVDALARFASSERDDAILGALLRRLCASDAKVVLINLEDLWLETRFQNVPGTSTELPNWRRPATLTLEEMQARFGPILQELAQLRGPAT